MSPPVHWRDRSALHAVWLLFALWLGWRLRGVLLLMFAAVIVAALLRALAQPLARLTGWRDRVAVLVAAAALVALLALAIASFAEPLAAQVQQLRTALPQAWAGARAWLETGPLGARVIELASHAAHDAAVPWARLASWATAVTGLLGDVLLVLLLGLYLALDPGLYRRGLLRLVTPARREAIGDALDRSGDALRRWLLAQGVTMLLVGTTVGIGLALLGIPVALALGVISGLLEFVPFVGAIASAVLSVTVSFAEGPRTALYVALFFLAMQQLEGNVVIPMVQRWAAHLPPVLSLLAVVVMGGLFGLPGVILGTPLTVVAQVLVERLWIAPREAAGAHAGVAPG